MFAAQKELICIEIRQIDVLSNSSFKVNNKNYSTLKLLKISQNISDFN